jgi:hypothetical protein
MEMTLVKSLHSGDPDVNCPVLQWLCELASADVLASGKCVADALQELFGLHPTVLCVHVTQAFLESSPPTVESRVRFPAETCHS